MIDFSKFSQWEGAKFVCERLAQAGFKAWLAGGCVRDALIGRTPNDFDVATDALPDAVEGLFEKSVSVGKTFGVISIPFKGYSIEVATFRSDGDYLDGRHPEKVVFTGPKEDAARRDFTINSLFYDVREAKVVDFFNGASDLSNKVLQTVGIPEKRFSEDYLRLLRALRFAAQLNFRIESKTYNEIIRLKYQVSKVSIERRKNEVEKIFRSRHPVRGLELLLSTGVLEFALPVEVIRDSKAVPAEGRDLKRVFFAIQSELNFGSGFLMAEWSTAFYWSSFIFGWIFEFRADEKTDALKASIFARETGTESVFSRARQFVEKIRLSKVDAKKVMKLLKLLEVFPEFFSAKASGSMELEKKDGEKILFASEVPKQVLEILFEVWIPKGHPGRERAERWVKISYLWQSELPKPLIDGHFLKAKTTIDAKAFGRVLQKVRVAQVEGRLSSVSEVEEFLKDCGDLRDN